MNCYSIYCGKELVHKICPCENNYHLLDEYVLGNFLVYTPSPTLDMSPAPALAPILDMSPAPTLDTSPAPSLDTSPAPSLDTSPASSPSPGLLAPAPSLGMYPPTLAPVAPVVAQISALMQSVPPSPAPLPAPATSPTVLGPDLAEIFVIIVLGCICILMLLCRYRIYPKTSQIAADEVDVEDPLRDAENAEDE